MKTEVRYRIDNYGRGLVDERSHKILCHEESVVEYFAKKKSQTRAQVTQLDQQIEELVRQRNELRSRCRHLHAVAKYGSNTGNYDPTQDCYWVDFHCYDCGRRWREDQ